MGTVTTILATARSGRTRGMRSGVSARAPCRAPPGPLLDVTAMKQARRDIAMHVMHDGLVRWQAEVSGSQEGRPVGSEQRLSTVVELAQGIREGTHTAREVVAASLEAIARLNPQLNAFSAVVAQQALEEAEQRDAQWQAGRECGPLHGVPIAIKDENDVAGLPTAYGGAAFTTAATQDSEVVRRLRAAGAVIIGKTRMPEFGIWPFTETSANGYTRNPWNVLRSTAGSSGGTAAAVASGMVPAGIGGDGGGSIRLPSSWCGLFGLKCQRGRTSAAPNANLWRGLGVIGPLTRTVADSALIYDVISGSTAVDQWRAEPLTVTLTEALTRDPGPLRIAVAFKNPGGGPEADAETAGAARMIAHACAELGHDVVDVVPDYPRLGTAFVAQVAAGVTDEAARAEHPELLERRTRGLVRMARPLARRASRGEQRGVALGQAFDQAFFSHWDVLLTPTTPFAALPIGQLDGAGTLRALRRAAPVASYTGLWNVLGNPAAAVPAGFTSSGLPLSVQLIGPAQSEPLLVQLAAQLERVRPWADRIPPVHP